MPQFSQTHTCQRSPERSLITTSPATWGAWQQRVRFIAYAAFGPLAMGRWDGWLGLSLATAGRIDPNPLAWDGASTSHYVGNGASGYPWDSKVFSVQVESMNHVFMLAEALRLNPGFWYEISAWNG